jgi:hypothetical protein
LQTCRHDPGSGASRETSTWGGKPKRAPRTSQDRRKKFKGNAYKVRALSDRSGKAGGSSPASQAVLGHGQNAPEQQTASLTNEGVPVDEAACSGATFALTHVVSLVANSWADLTSYAVSRDWRWKDSEELKPLDENKKELIRYADLVAQLRRSGVKKIFLAENHWDRANLDMIAGATSGGNRKKACCSTGDGHAKGHAHWYAKSR